MTLDFIKMTGAGNDFILADNRKGDLRLTQKQVARLCHRQFGIGADGLMLLVPSRTRKADWAWQFWNSDGSEAEMCGNGARCFARYVASTTGWTAPTLSFETAAGVIHAELEADRVTVNLTSPHSLRLREKVMTSTGELEVSSLNTGVPHAVVFVPDADQAMVQQRGAELRWHDHFKPKGTNVNFAQELGPGHIRVRTYERGVEGETLACGTGAVACATLLGEWGEAGGVTRLRTRSGKTLTVTLRPGPEGLTPSLAGEGRIVFEGVLREL